MTATRRLILAVDCGSTNFKGALFSGELERLGEGSVPVPYSVRDGASVELSAEALWRTFQELATQTADSAGVCAQAITAVAFDSQAQTFALFSPVGEAVTPFYSWLDCRAEAEAAELALRLGAEFHRHCSFAPPIPQLQLSKMLWVARHDAKAAATSGRVMLLPGFLAARLGVPNTTDRNLAAMGGAYSLVANDWWSDGLAACGMASAQMPRLVDVGASVCASAAPFSPLFRPDIAVTFAGNDQTAGAYGNACEHGGMVVTLGTALVVYRHAGTRPGPYHPGSCWGPYPGGSYYELATIDQGCQALDWARSRLMPRASLADFDAAVERVVVAHAEPAAPLFQPGRIAGGRPWIGASEDTAAAAYAVLEGISFALRRLLEVNVRAGGQVHEVAVIGGGARSGVWLSLLANVLGIPVRRGSGDALLGAAAMSVGAQRSALQPEHSPFGVERERAAVLATRYRQWSDLP